jgi:hypothetical protein
MRIATRILIAVAFALAFIAGSQEMLNRRSTPPTQELTSGLRIQNPDTKLDERSTRIILLGATVIPQELLEQAPEIEWARELSRVKQELWEEDRLDSVVRTRRGKYRQRRSD